MLPILISLSTLDLNLLNKMIKQFNMHTKVSWDPKFKLIIKKKLAKIIHNQVEMVTLVHE